jgi:hypothetical protein
MPLTEYRRLPCGGDEVKSSPDFGSPKSGFFYAYAPPRNDSRHRQFPNAPPLAELGKLRRSRKMKRRAL